MTRRNEALEDHQPPRPRTTRVRHVESTEGRWKLVYADFVTVLMCFFVVAWASRLVLVSDQSGLDRTCTDQIADLVRYYASRPPIAVKGDAVILVTNDATVEGVRFTLVDAQAELFKRGEAVIAEKALPYFGIISRAIKQCSRTHKIRIEGYTDAYKFQTAARAYTNWELSADRANAARRQLLLSGIPEEQVMAVVGYGDSQPVLPQNPMSAVNRRVSITVLAPLAEGSVP